MKTNYHYDINIYQNINDILNDINRIIDQHSFKYGRIKEIRISCCIRHEILNNFTIDEFEKNTEPSNSIILPYKDIDCSSDTTLRDYEIAIISEK